MHGKNHLVKSLFHPEFSNIIFSVFISFITDILPKNNQEKYFNGGYVIWNTRQGLIWWIQ